ncbi:MAG: hypothetical protein LBP58_00830, partial [Azoarcus sp.]|nr:hypothetical protein [Azoarcus sp.]
MGKFIFVMLFLAVGVGLALAYGGVSQSTFLILMAIAIGVLFIFGIFAMFAHFYRKVEQGYAMIVNTLRSEPEVTFTGRMV